jgi:type I restriction enzyme S subunit
MSKLEQLLQGVEVEWKTLGEYCKVLRGNRLTKKELIENGKYPVFHGGLIPLGLYDKFNRKANQTMIINTGSIGEVVWSGVDFWSSDGTFVVETSDCIEDKFLYYYLKIQEGYFKSQKREGGVPTIDRTVVESLQIPIPPIAIQKEIVRILDTFTDITAELTAELTARKKQYSHYLEQLFVFDENEVQHLPMANESIGEFQRGKRFVKTDLITEGVPTIHYGEMYTHYGIWANETISFVSDKLVKDKNLRLANKGDVVIVAAGETIKDIGLGTAWLGEQGVVVHDACFSYKTILNPKYVAYFTRTKQFHDQIKKHISSGKISAINARGLGKAIIPVPTPIEQERIVSILDKFDILTNSISEGLPKEIELRKKQYEYYRDLLLTFPKKETA